MWRERLLAKCLLTVFRVERSFVPAATERNKKKYTRTSSLRIGKEDAAESQMDVATKPGMHIIRIFHDIWLCSSDRFSNVHIHHAFLGKSGRTVDLFFTKIHRFFDILTHCIAPDTVFFAASAGIARQKNNDTLRQACIKSSHLPSLDGLITAKKRLGDMMPLCNVQETAITIGYCKHKLTHQNLQEARALFFPRLRITINLGYRFRIWSQHQEWLTRRVELTSTLPVSNYMLCTDRQIWQSQWHTSSPRTRTSCVLNWCNVLWTLKRLTLWTWTNRQTTYPSEMHLHHANLHQSLPAFLKQDNGALLALPYYNATDRPYHWPRTINNCLLFPAAVFQLIYCWV